MNNKDRIKVKDLIAELQRLNPDADVLLGSDPELNHIYKNVVLNVFSADIDDGDEIELTPENIDKIKQVIIWGY
jgi:hypothetical protein